MSLVKIRTLLLLLSLVCNASPRAYTDEQSDLPAPDPRLAARESEYYSLTDIEIPEGLYIEVSSFLQMPGGRLALGTRRGDIFLTEGLFDASSDPSFRRFAGGLHEVFGLALEDGVLYATQQCEVTRIVDLDNDGRADRFETVSDGWGFGGEHEFTFGSTFDRNGYIWVVCCLTGSYTSEHPFRGWCLRVNADGETIPTCSGIRSPGGVGMNASGDMFYTESQGPWNGACSLKHLKPGGFMGHPISYKWYELAPHMGPAPAAPTGGSQGRLLTDRERIPELVPPAVIFPYRKTSQSVSDFVLDETNGKFGPFTGHMFFVDYTLSLVLRAHLEKVNGVYQGACFPFRQGMKTGLLAATLSKDGQLLVGGCSRGWPTRGSSPEGMQRLEWTGKTPFEMHEINIRPDGFRLAFTAPVDPDTASQASSYDLETYTYHYRSGYGSPEIDKTKPMIERVEVAEDRRSVRLYFEVVRGHVHEVHVSRVRSASGKAPLHDVGYYTVNEVPPPARR